jgi:hypothetical protein
MVKPHLFQRLKNGIEQLKKWRSKSLIKDLLTETLAKVKAVLANVVKELHSIVLKDFSMAGKTVQLQ